MPSRSYVSPVREKASAAKRSRAIEAAASLLREAQGITGFSLDAVAKAAGVTRITVYNQFGSRSGLLEALLSDVAQRGGIERLGQVDVSTDPAAALAHVVEIFTAFWSSDTIIGTIFDAMAHDPDVSAALHTRFSSGRSVIAAIVDRLRPDDADDTRRDTTDLIYALTDFPTYRSLAPGRSSAEVGRLVLSASRRVLRLAD
jgi:AcrR family transcriptional regulator